MSKRKRYNRAKTINKRNRLSRIYRSISGSFYMLDLYCETLVPNDGRLQGQMRENYKQLQRDFAELSRIL